jgi:hypothetical protein
LGRIEVSVQAADSLASDTTVYPVRDFEACGSQLEDNSLQRVGDAVSGAAVWLAAPDGGKELPARRRYEVNHERCLLHPRVQTVTVGGTLNIRNSDAALHVLRFADAQTGELLARVTQAERGQIVPNDFLLDVPRVIAITCESHPWTRGWIHVFNHPYHGTTGRNGNVVLDSVPAVPQRVVLWHERFGEQAADVHVVADSAARVNFLLGAVRR